MDPELVERAKRGDLDAYGLLVERTQAQVHGIVRRVIRDPHLAMDTVQDVYLRAFRRLADLRDPQAFPGWLGRIAKTTALNQIRVRRQTFVDPIEVSRLPAPTETEAEWTDEQRHALSLAMLCLSPEDRRLCERYYHGGWTTKRLAAEEELTGAAVRKRLERIRKRLRREIEMTADEAASADLPAKIIELLSRPLLTDLPENPVGAIWDAVRASHDDHEEVDLVETLDLSAIESAIGAEGMAHLPDDMHRVNDRRVLRWDTSIPMLLAAAGRPADIKLMGAGKVYRNDPVDRTHLQVFHQAEILHVGDDVEEWDLMPRITRWVDGLLDGSRLRVEQVAYPMICDRAWEVSVNWAGEWSDILGWGMLRPGVVRALGHDPDRVRAVGVGLGLERIACMKFGIDDVRKVEVARIDREP
jgi:RNA polymerase sigma-70 factor, ECF subfamily